MPKELCHLLRKLEFLAEDTASLQGALEITPAYFDYSPDERNQEPLAHRSTYSKFTAVKSKPASSCVPGMHFLSMASALKRLYTMDLMSSTLQCSFTATGISSCWHSYGILIGDPSNILCSTLTCIFVFTYMHADMNHNWSSKQHHLKQEQKQFCTRFLI